MVASLVMGALGKNLMGDQAATKGGGLSDLLGQVLGGSGGAGSSAVSAASATCSASWSVAPARPEAGAAQAARQPRRSPQLDRRRQHGAASPRWWQPRRRAWCRIRQRRAARGADGATERARTSLGAMLGANTPKGEKGDKMLSKVKKDLGHA